MEQLDPRPPGERLLVGGRDLVERARRCSASCALVLRRRSSARRSSSRSSAASPCRACPRPRPWDRRCRRCGCGCWLSLGDLGRLGRRHLACRVVAVGQHDQHLFRRLALLEHLDRKADRVAERGARPGHAGQRVRDHRVWTVSWSMREGHQRIGRVAEGDQPDAVAGPPGDEIRDHLSARHRRAPQCCPADRGNRACPSTATGRAPASGRAAARSSRSAARRTAAAPAPARSEPSTAARSSLCSQLRARQRPSPRSASMPAASATSSKNGKRTAEVCSR